MSFIRVQKSKDNPYVQIDKRSIGDQRLSWKAKGILSYLLSLPDDWKIYTTELMKHAPDGETSLRAGMKELEEAGYLVKEQTRNENGKITGTDFTVFESPNTTPSKTICGKPKRGKSKCGKSSTTNNYLTNTDSTNTDNTKKDLTSPPKKEKTEHQKMFDAIREITKLDTKVKSNSGQIARASKDLLKAGYTPDHVFAFGNYWLTDWRYEKDKQPPPLTTVSKELSKVRNENTGGVMRVEGSGRWVTDEDTGERVQI